MPDSRDAKSLRQCGRPLTYEEKWMVHHVFEVFQQHKRDQAVMVVDDPYQMTSQYTGVSRTKVAQIATPRPIRSGSIRLVADVN